LEEVLGTQLRQSETQIVESKGALDLQIEEERGSFEQTVL